MRETHRAKSSPEHNCLTASLDGRGAEREERANRLCPEPGRPVGAPADSQAFFASLSYSETQSDTGHEPKEELVDYVWHNR